MHVPSSHRLVLVPLLSIAASGCGGSTESRPQAPDSGISGDCAIPQLWFLDLDGDRFGDDSVTVTACQAPAGYVAQGGDCNDYDPLRHPGGAADPGFVFDRCGKGQTVEPMNTKADWTVMLSSPSGGSGRTDEETGGCVGNRLAFKYDLPDLSACDVHLCSWVVMRKTLPTPIDLSGSDDLLVPMNGDPNDPPFQVDLRLESSDGCRVTWPMKGATGLPARRTAVVPLKWFSTAGPDRHCTLDLTKVRAIEIGVYAETPPSGALGKDFGVLHLDAITAVKHSDLRMSPTFFSCPNNNDFGVRGRIVADLLGRHKDAISQRGHPFVPDWFEETPRRYSLYNQALLLMVFTLEGSLWGNTDARSAAEAVARGFLDLQDQISDGTGRWYDDYADSSDGTGVALPTELTSPRAGNIAWAVMALDLYRDLLAPSPRWPVDDAIAMAANWLESKLDEHKAARHAAGAAVEDTSGNISTFFALVAAERFSRAAEVRKYLLETAWKADEQRFWMGAQDPGLAIDVIGNWGAAFLRAVGEHEKALAGLGLAAGVFPARSFDDRHGGLGDIAGPWQPTVESTAQYLAAGGAGSHYLLPELLAYENDGTFPGSPDDFSGGTARNTMWRGIAPAAWVYLAVSPDILARLSMPVFFDDFEGESPWALSEESWVSRPECYGKGTGTVARSSDVATSGAFSLCVTANPGKTSALSDHVTARRQAASAGHPGTLRLEADVYIPTDAGLSGQAGPELIVHNTRQAATGSFVTSTIGIRYVANAHGPDFGNWNLWGDSQTGQPGWKSVPELNYELTPGVWYHIKLIVNFDSHRYSDLIVTTPGSAKYFDLSSHLIPSETAKTNEESLWVSIGAENQWNECGATASTEYRVCYDNVMIRR